MLAPTNTKRPDYSSPYLSIFIGYSYSYNHDVSLWRQISLYFYVVTLPSLGLFYFLVFIRVSPHAWNTLRDMLLTLLGWCSLYPCRVDKTRSIVTYPPKGSGQSRSTARSKAGDFPSEANSCRLFSQSGESFDHRGMSTDSLSASTMLDERRLFQHDYFNYEEADERELSREITRIYWDPTSSKEGELTTATSHSGTGTVPNPIAKSIDYSNGDDI